MNLTPPTFSFAFSHGTKVKLMLAAGCTYGAIYLWDSSTGESYEEPIIDRLTGHRDLVRSITFTVDGSKQDDCSVRLWDVSKKQQLVRFNGHTKDVLSVASTGNTADDTIRIWDVSTGTELPQMNDHHEWVWSEACSPGGGPNTNIVACGYDMSIRLWDMSTGRQIAKLDGHTHPVASVAFSPDGKALVSASGGCGIYRHDDHFTFSKDTQLMG